MGLPGAVLRAAVDVGPVVQQVLDDGEPAAGARLVESAVAGVVPVIHLADSVLQTVQHHLLKRGSQHRGREGFRGGGEPDQTHKPERDRRARKQAFRFTVPVGGKLGERRK